MLKVFHKHKKGIFGIVIAGFCALLMVPFGMDMIRTNNKDQTIALRVGDIEVPFTEFYYRVNRWQAMFRQQFGENYNQVKGMLNLEQRTVDELIDGIVMDKFGEQSGLNAGSEHIRRKLTENPYFAGQVTKADYKQFLAMQGMNSQMFESLSKREIIVEQVLALAADLLTPSEAELRAANITRKRKAAFNYLTFSKKDYLEKVDLSNEEKLKEYYTENAESFRTKRAVAFNAIAFSPSEYMSKVELSDEDLQDRYQQDAHKYYHPEEVHLRKILIKNEEKKPDSPLDALLPDQSNDSGDVSLPTTENIARGKADQIIERLKAGDKFAEVAAEDSEDSTTKLNGGDLGWKSYRLLSEKLRAVAVDLEKGKHSKVIETENGFEIIFVEDRRERRQKTFDEVKTQLEASLRLEDAPAYAQAAAEEFFDSWEEEFVKNKTSLEAYLKGKEHKLIQVQDPVELGASEAGVPMQLIAKAVDLGAEAHEVIEINDSYYITEITKVREPEIPEFNTVKAKVSEQYKVKQADTLVREAAKKALASLTGKEKVENGDGEAEGPHVPSAKNLEELAKKLELKLESTELSERASAQGPIFSMPDMRQKLFALQLAKPIYDEVISVGESHYVVQLSKSELPKQDQLTEKELDQLKTGEKNRASRGVYGAFLKTLRSEQDVWVNPEALKKRG